ncbi:Ldh family oxidoreductase [Pseudonocardia alni]|nr:Ldh family oxidoreductase [Pseudonocardia antarctica]
MALGTAAAPRAAGGRPPDLRDGAVPRLTTNPIAFAAPARRNPPFELDMSTSAVAANKVKVFDLLGRPVPQGWVTEEAGDPVTDPAAAMAYLHEHLYGGLSPLGATVRPAATRGTAWRSWSRS